MSDRSSQTNPASAYEFSATAIDGKEQSLSDYAGNVSVIVNVASKCGFTSQYAGLEQLYQAYKDQGFTVLGFPCNQFGGQEPGSDEEISSFCETSFGVSFPLFSKIEVNGPGTLPLFQFLKKAKPGFAGTTGIKWNFTKFLVDRSGTVVRRYAPQDTPGIIKRRIEQLLGEE